GETLSTELGVSASGFGAGASRPIIRGLEGARVKMLENGMTVADVSGLSNDHAVSADGAISRQIEILRGPAALLYGSGAIGGLVNVVNERIPTALEQHPTGQLEMRYGTVDRAGAVSGSADAAVGQVGLHVDGSIRHADDYRIPGARVAGEPDIGRLPHSATRQHSGGAGLSLVGDWGHLGASVSTLSNLYGIPSLEGSRIDQDQRRYDVDGLLKAPAAGIEQVRVKFGYTDYRHAELDDAGAAEVRFANRALESRVEVAHVPLAGWHGSVGLQTENTHFSALNAEGGPDTVPATHSTTRALFAVEEREFGGVRVNAGVRGEQVKRTPVGAPQRSFDLGSASLGAQWPFAQDYTVGATLSLAQRAPATEELYSGGPHDATATFDIGNPDFRKETSRNLELSLQRQRGKLAWKANLFVNKVKDFIYGDILPGMVDEEGAPQAGGPLRLRRFAQADATLHGAEAEVGYNQHQLGWSGRAFADFSRGRLDDLGNLPLQPAARFGADLTYRSSEVRATLSAVRTLRQERLAAFEGAHAPAYTQLNASISHTQHLQGVDLTWFLLGKNLLNEEIRLATSLLKDVAPLPGRSWVFGVRIKF
ncbi:MAG: TonB-dependent receptor, partial [Gammaproteobacteria bacterium]